MSERSHDPFSLLGVPVSFLLTKRQIESAYLARIAGAHPDHAGVDSGVDAAALNDARRALLDVERRANLVLASMGGPSASDDDSLPDGFLMEIMETRMEIESALASGDPAEREKWTAWADEQRAEYTTRVAEAFATASSGDPASGDGAGVLRDARRMLNAWRYIERLIEQLDPDYDPASADFS